jgi:hypothetical protein
MNNNQEMLNRNHNELIELKYVLMKDDEFFFQVCYLSVNTLIHWTMWARRSRQPAAGFSEIFVHAPFSFIDKLFFNNKRLVVVGSMMLIPICSFALMTRSAPSLPPATLSSGSFSPRCEPSALCVLKIALVFCVAYCICIIF